jgi:hypothetical protein
VRRIACCLRSQSSSSRCDEPIPQIRDHPYYFWDGCGFLALALFGASVMSCQTCNGEAFSINDVPELHYLSLRTSLKAVSADREGASLSQDAFRPPLLTEEKAKKSPTHSWRVCKHKKRRRLRASPLPQSQAGDNSLRINGLQAPLGQQISRKSRRNSGHLIRSLPACASDRGIPAASELTSRLAVQFVLTKSWAYQKLNPAGKSLEVCGFDC